MVGTLTPNLQTTPLSTSTSTLLDQLEGRLKQLQDDYDTLSEQARFSQSRGEALEAGLERSAEALRRAVAAGAARACVAQRELLEARARLCSVEEALAEAERRAEGEEFFKLAQEAACLRALEACARQEEEAEGLAEELEAARGYAKGVRALLVAREEQDGVGMAGGEGAWMVVEDRVGVESREAVAGVAAMWRDMMDECQGAVDRAQGLEQMVDELVADEDRLVEDVQGLRRKIEELEVNAYLGLCMFLMRSLSFKC